MVLMSASGMDRGQIARVPLTGAEGRISHLKRGYGLDRSRLKGNEGHQIWGGWATLTYNLDTYTTLT